MTMAKIMYIVLLMTALTSSNSTANGWVWLTRCHMPATASRFAGVVDRISGDRDRRLAKYEAEYKAYRNEQKRLQGEQLDIFGEVA